VHSERTPEPNPLDDIVVGMNCVD